MAELATASSRLGLPLCGERFTLSDGALDGPAIAYMHNSEGGHFVVLRPVGSAGSMIQVLNPPFTPRILDYEVLLSSNDWTGQLLVPARPWYQESAGWLMIGGISILIGATVARHFYRSREAHRVPGRSLTG
jgi:hypothetical protein